MKLFGIMLIILELLSFILLIYLSIEYTQEDLATCKNQCRIKNLSFYEYRDGYSQACNCQNKITGEILTIYTR